MADNLLGEKGPNSDVETHLPLAPVADNPFLQKGNEMLKENEIIELTGDEAINIIKEVNYFLISLNNISHYYYNEKNISDTKRLEYERETTNFIDNNKITKRLAEIRKVLSSKFNNELGDDDMDDIERATEDTQYWEKPDD
ncbi:hypothetical protein [Serratia ficaria]|uniref:hypothetical protein n=1 Tax=Serratia ficaria TaxID=61651 RepID=UPI0021C8858E|nr:hypothetical protein [Serratia ficaria]